MTDRNENRNESPGGCAAQGIRSALVTAAHQLREAAEEFDRLAELVGRIAATENDGALVDIAPILSGALRIGQLGVPDLSALASTLERHAATDAATPEAEESGPVEWPCAGLVGNELPCHREAVPGLVLCFHCLWQRAGTLLYGRGRQYPKGSGLPGIGAVPLWSVVVAENGVRWRRVASDLWEATGPVGNGTRWSWRKINDSEDGGPVVGVSHAGLAELAVKA